MFDSPKASLGQGDFACVLASVFGKWMAIPPPARLYACLTVRDGLQRFISRFMLSDST